MAGKGRADMVVDETRYERARERGGARKRSGARRTLALSVSALCSVGLLLGSVGTAAAAVPAVAPANDNFANATTLTGVSVVRTGDTNVGATKETGEPVHGTESGDAGGASVWYTWTAGANGNVTIDTSGSALDTVLAAYTGSPVSALTAVARNDDDLPSYTSKITFGVTGGTVYSIAVDGWHGVTGTFNIHLALSGPANDAFSTPTALPGPAGSRTGDNNLGATKESGEPNHGTEAGDTGGASVWYAWTAPASAPVNVDTAGSALDTVLAVYTGSAVNGLSLVASNDDDGGCFPCTESRLGFSATAGTTYRIAVDGYHGLQGTFNFHLAIAPPPNDAFANSISIAGLSTNQFGTNAGATKEAGEPIHNPDPNDAGGASIWYSWTAPASGPVTMDTVGSDFDTVLAVYTGNAVNALTLVASNDDENYPSILTSKLTFPATAGAAYRIAIDGLLGHQGATSLHVALTAAPPANDAFANAFTLTGGSATRTNDSNVAATKEAGEPVHGTDVNDAGGASVWYAWTAPATASATIDTAGSNFDTVLAAYTGNAVNTLTFIAKNDDELQPTILTSKITFAATAGTTYRIAVDGWGAAQGLVNVHVSQLSTPVVSGFAAPAQKQKKPVTILGSGFTGATVVAFAKAGGGTVNSTSFSVTDDGHITATVPPLATTGHVSVTTPGGTGSSSINLKIKPTLRSFTPTSAAVGATITLTGTGFTGATRVTFFSGVRAKTFTVLSDTKISVKVPVGATTGKLQVTTPGGKANSKPVFQVL